MTGEEFAEAVGAPPAAMEQVLESLPLRIGVYVPDDLIENWFAPGEGMSPPPPKALTAAADYAQRFECEFKHDAARKEGVFWKWVPGI
jgi:hypothetical protein